MMIAQADLEFREGTSDKFYRVWIDEATLDVNREPAAEGMLAWRVGFAYGRRGYDPQGRGFKQEYTSDKKRAFRVARETVQAKLDKGYKLVGETSSIPLSPLSELLPENILPGRPAGTFPITGDMLAAEQEAEAQDERSRRQRESKQNLIAGATAGAAVAGAREYRVVLASGDKRWTIRVSKSVTGDDWFVSVGVNAAKNPTIDAFSNRTDALKRAALIVSVKVRDGFKATPGYNENLFAELLGDPRLAAGPTESTRDNQFEAAGPQKVALGKGGDRFVVEIARDFGRGLWLISARSKRAGSEVIASTVTERIQRADALDLAQSLINKKIVDDGFKPLLGHNANTFALLAVVNGPPRRGDTVIIRNPERFAPPAKDKTGSKPPAPAGPPAPHPYAPTKRKIRLED